jgi:internalin A
VQDQLNALWDAEQPTETAEFEFEMLHPGFVRGLICEIGSEAGVSALYWLGGVCVYDTATRSHALIEQHMQDARRGRISVQTQGGQALLDRLSGWLESRIGRHGLNFTRIGGRSPRRISAEDVSSAPARAAADDRLPVTPGAPPASATEYFISYAWGDDSTPEGIRRAAVVEKLCSDYAKAGVPIRRDISTLQFGDSLSAFVKRIGAGNRIFTILSKKYLESAWCMAELLEIWRYSRQNEDDFTRRVRVLCLPDAKISTFEDRLEHAIWWKQRFARIWALVKEHDFTILGEDGGRELAQMNLFHQHVADILGIVARRVQPRTLEQLEQYGFDADPPT